MAFAQRCPLCYGKGTLEDNTTAGGKTCHGCGGRGWVEVGNYPVYPAPYPVTPWPPYYTQPILPWTITWANGKGNISG